MKLNPSFTADCTTRDRGAGEVNFERLRSRFIPGSARKSPCIEG
ncbi:MAG: hypothetical protein QNJ55_20055 [Xenococcus sp. MO_188.B8]|nr:hypothetical protein [Xenococcus sp. MO_188.B8]